MNTGRPRSPHRRYFRHARTPSRDCVRTLVMAYQIDLFCIPQLADAGCLEADQAAPRALSVISVITQRRPQPTGP